MWHTASCSCDAWSGPAQFEAHAATNDQLIGLVKGATDVLGAPFKRCPTVEARVSNGHAAGVQACACFGCHADQESDA